MKTRWFRQWGWIYFPTAWQGWSCAALTLIFCARVFLVVDRHSHSVSDTFYGVFPYAVPAFGILGWIASKTTRRPE